MLENNKYIGGFFELELSNIHNNAIHDKGIALVNGRACLNLIIKKLSPSKVYLPYYACNALFSPLESQNIPFEFYAIDSNFEPVNIPKLKKDELLIYINYFGIKNSFSDSLVKEYKKNVVIDNTHQFFHYGYDDSYSFTSARKHFGVPDGAYLYGSFDSNLINKIKDNTNVSIDHHVQRLVGKQQEGYRNYVKYENTLSNELKKMSLLSGRLLAAVDYQYVQNTRLANYSTLHDALGKYNLIHVDNSKVYSPFCYPLLLENKIDRNLFYKEKIFIPTLWQDVLERGVEGFKQEEYYSNNILPLPIDHRYKQCDMEKIINFIKRNLSV